MCQYTGDTKDQQHYNQTHLTDREINDIVKMLLRESLENCSKGGLDPFCTLNPAPPVSTLNEPHPVLSISLIFTLFQLFSHMYIGRLSLPEKETSTRRPSLEA